jgi:hypothetical protein
MSFTAQVAVDGTTNHEAPGGHTVTEPTPAAAEETPAAQEGAPAEAAPTPPWGSDENFDAARAWKLIQDLKSDKEKLSTRPTLSDEQRQQLDEYNRLVEASKSEEQRRQEQIEAANRERDDSRAEAVRLRVALKHGISEDDFDLLGSGTEEQIEARASRIAEKNKAVEDAVSALTPPGSTPPVPRRPGEKLRPGAVPASPPPLADEEYPTGWLSPTQLARVQQARERIQ